MAAAAGSTKRYSYNFTAPVYPVAPSGSKIIFVVGVGASVAIAMFSLVLALV